MSKIINIELSVFGDTITGKTPSSNNPEDYGDSFMFVTPSDSFEEKIISKTQRYLSKTGIEKLKSKILPPKSILVTCIGSAMGKVAMNKTECITNQQINSIRIETSKFDSDYIYYVLKNNYKLLRNAATGSTAIPMLSKTDFDKLKINLHQDIFFQQKIAKVLSTLDAKIELNNRINKELEAMAKTLYDYWFVQFDFPNANGKPYKSSGGKMVYNEELKREIPEGWEVEELGNIEKNIITGKTPPKENKDFFNGNIPFITIGDIRGNMHIIKTEETLSESGADYQRNKYINKGAICVSCIATPGLVGFVTEPSQTNQQINTIECEKEENRYYLYFTIKDFFIASKAKTGNTFPNMNKGDFSAIKLLNPSADNLDKFKNIVKPIFDKILNNSQQSQHLTQLRDFLLPMLMNGQVSVK